MTEKITDHSEVKNIEESNSVDLDIVLELGSIGAGNAATSLSEIFQEPISIEVPKIHTLPPHRVPDYYDKHDVPTTAIYMELRGETNCDILLLFEVEEARKIAAMMAMVPSPEDVDPEMEASAIEELGSIMIGAFLSAIADFTGIQLIPMPPELVKGSFDSVLDTFLVKQALVSEVALVFDGCFRRSSSEAGGTIIVFPSLELQKILVDKGQDWLK